MRFCMRLCSRLHVFRMPCTHILIRLYALCVRACLCLYALLSALCVCFPSGLHALVCAFACTLAGAHRQFVCINVVLGALENSWHASWRFYFRGCSYACLHTLTRASLCMPVCARLHTCACAFCMAHTAVFLCCRPAVLRCSLACQKRRKEGGQEGDNM